MHKVNIYTVSNQKSPRAYPGTGCYILEYITAKGPATVTGWVELIASRNMFEVAMIIESVGRLNKPCELEIFTEVNYIPGLYKSGQMDKWDASGWVTSRGTEVVNKTALMKLKELLEIHQVNFHVKEEHSYSKWMAREIERRKK